MKKTGVELIAAERKRQVEKLNYSADHDGSHVDGELALAAACYASPARVYLLDDSADSFEFTDPWPWAWRMDKRRRRMEVVAPENSSHKKRVDLLIKAGALIAAEIDRLGRLET